ncbi:putative xyloglucan endotransglucosylase/hydrolase protein 32 [Hibiscus syriacus]|uniref:Xyloglucan endotransglucosylase/hydrolase n=1 Tax=Hibiscus syriacus TaxID=106335 RepID=A0A6A3B9S2_HIBSY|nr:putative xyloglucan endotransglucosylase/hydrolase protein 32 [Hibiscus syriacus]
MPSLFCLTSMAPIFSLFLALFFIVSSSNAQGPPSPGFSPSSRVSTVTFDQGFRNLWGPQHQKLDQGSLTIWLDKTSGSGFKSLHSYQSGYFGAAMKLDPGYTAGVITSFYLSNNEEHPGNHDEIDIEFLGTTPDKPYTLQTNVFIKGSGDRNRIGREMRVHLWRYSKKSDATFPTRPMWVYGSIWDASSWATENGRYKADYNFQPFVGWYTDFRVSGCTANDPIFCRPPSASLYGSESLSRQQVSTMLWVQRNYLVYDYCHDPHRDHTQIPEC